jgi:hypothetical protein
MATWSSQVIKHIEICFRVDFGLNRLGDYPKIVS